MLATIRPAGPPCQTPPVNGSGRSSHTLGRRQRRATMVDMAKADRAVFRLPVVALLIPLVLAIFATPLATVGGAWIWLYVLPVLVLIYVVITRTVADPSGVRTSGITGVHRLAWTELDGLEFSGSRWAVAVAHDGRRLRLPMVRPRDLPGWPRYPAGRCGSTCRPIPRRNPGRNRAGNRTADRATIRPCGRGYP